MSCLFHRKTEWRTGFDSSVRQPSPVTVYRKAGNHKLVRERVDLPRGVMRNVMRRAGVVLVEFGTRTKADRVKVPRDAFKLLTKLGG
jgi:hypothetical protein